MRKIMKYLAVVVLVLALAGETVLLLRAHERYVSTHRQQYASELSEELLTLSASLRLGETERFDAALENFSTTEEKLLPFLDASEKERLESYVAALNAPETRSLLQQNALRYKLNLAMRDFSKLSEAEELLKDTEDKAELKDTLHKLKDCEVYCSSEDYAKIEAALKSESENLKQSTEKLEAESAERLGSEAMLEWLDMLK